MSESTAEPTEPTQAKAQEAEAKGEGSEFEFLGVKYSTVCGDDAPEVYDAIELMEEGRFLSALKKLLGGKEYARFKEIRPTPNQGGEMLKAALVALGVDMEGYTD